MNPTNRFLAVACLTLLVARFGAAQAQEAAVLPVLPTACEVALALSAAPEHLREGATVWALTAEGFRKERDGTNGFSCAVNRDHPRVLKPTCYDAEGAATILPKVIFFGNALAAGRPVAEIIAEVEKRFDNGELVRPRRPGIAYMLSNYNRPYNPRDDSLGWFPPHYMFYAPDLTPADIGFDMAAWHADRTLPLIGYQGPHGFMIVIVRPMSEPKRGDFPACPDWVRADPPK